MMIKKGRKEPEPEKAGSSSNHRHSDTAYSFPRFFMIITRTIITTTATPAIINMDVRSPRARTVNSSISLVLTCERSSVASTNHWTVVPAGKAPISHSYVFPETVHGASRFDTLGKSASYLRLFNSSKNIRTVH